MLQVKESWEEAAVAGEGGLDLHMHGVIAAPRVRKAGNLWWLATEGNLSHQQTCVCRIRAMSWYQRALLRDKA